MAARMVSMVSSSLDRLGAKPPSSPTEVARPLDFRMEARAWNTSAHQRRASLKLGRAHRYDHKLLRVHGVGGVCAAVQDVHHGHGQAVAVHAAQKTVQGHLQRSGGSAAGGNGDRQNGVCAQIGFVLGAVGPEHGGINGIDVGGIHAHHRVSDDGVDVLHSLGHAFAR